MPKPSARSSQLPSASSAYARFLAELKTRIVSARLSAARAVNGELILLYWDIGRAIVEKQETEGWGQSVVEKLAADLRAEFPDMRGFSASNLWRMRQFFFIPDRTRLSRTACARISSKDENARMGS